jgi:hypothetical protein
LPKTNFENYYERKLHEEREGHNAVANKLLMGAIGAKIKDAMHNTIAHGKNSKNQQYNQGYQNQQNLLQRDWQNQQNNSGFAGDINAYN